MIVDTSAMVAIVNGESDARSLLALMRDADELQMSTCSVLELSLVLGPERREQAARLLSRAGIQLAPFTAEQLAAAQEGHARYGKGSGARAKLNFGDCVSYALAKTTGQPLLFKGDDFTHTDVVSAL